jgi:hypothetical protein
MPEISMSQQPDLSPTIQRMNLLEKAELEKLGQKVDDEGNLISTEKKNKKSKRFKLLVALAFLGTSLLVNYQGSSVSGSENKADRLMTTIVEEDDDAEETEQTEVQTITSLIERLADFSTTHDFEIVQTNENSHSIGLARNFSMILLIIVSLGIIFKDILPSKYIYLSYKKSYLQMVV